MEINSWFDVFGPFDLSRLEKSVPAKQPEFWNQVQEASQTYEYGKKELERSIGCYVFALQNGESIKPWYVGMTLAQTGFRGEILQSHKRGHYDDVITERKGKPIIFLLPLVTAEGRFSRDRTSTKPLLEWVEKMLFGLAVSRNPKCRNIRDTKYLRNVVVHGIFNSRPPGVQGPEVSAARKMFGIS